MSLARLFWGCDEEQTLRFCPRCGEISPDGAEHDDADYCALVEARWAEHDRPRPLGLLPARRMDVVAVFSAAPAPALALGSLSTTPLADMRAAGLERWAPEATGGVWRLAVTDAELDLLEADPACVVWGPVAAAARAA